MSDMIAEPLDSLYNFFDENPYEIVFDDTKYEIFDCGVDSLVNFWWLSLVLTGNFTSPTFDYNGRKITVINEDYLHLIEDEIREEIAKPEINPAELFKMFLWVLEECRSMN